jgi:hypothetical protein
MAKCINPTVPDPPQFPAGFSLVMPQPPGLPNVNLCCQIHPEDYLPELPPVPYAIPLTITQIGIINNVLRVGQQAVQDYIDQLVPECPQL